MSSSEMHVAVASIGLVCLAACVNDQLPTSARVQVEGSPAAPLELVVSNNFLVSQGDTPDQRQTVPLDADTIAVSGSFDRVFDISEFARVFVLLRNYEATPESVRLRVLVDGSIKYDEQGVLADGTDLHFVFTSRSTF